MTTRKMAEAVAHIARRLNNIDRVAHTSDSVYIKTMEGEIFILGVVKASEDIAMPEHSH